MRVDEAIRGRRTHKVYSGGAISREALTELVTLATWAPNHRFTEPWRFSVVHGRDRLDAMNAAVQEGLDAMGKAGPAPGDPGGDELARKLQSKKKKMATRLASAAAVIVASWVRSPDDPALDREDYAATCCAVQNMLLAAHARGFGSLWSTSKMLSGPGLRRFYGLGDDEGVAAVVFLGTPCAELEGRRHRSPASVTRWV